MNASGAPTRNFRTEATSAGKALSAPNANQIGSAPQVQFTARIRAFLKSFLLCIS